MPALYQHILSGVASYQELGNRVVRQIEAAYAFRQVEQVRELARVLTYSPISEHQLIGQYYLVWCKCREKEYRPDVLEHVAEHSRTYKAKALISRAAFDVYQGNAESAFYFYAEALKVNPTISDAINASAAIATVKSIEGFSGSALKDIENLLPLLRYAEPLTMFFVMNAYAVELIENDRLNDAESVLARAILSPFATAYPELQETCLEIRSKQKQRSAISISAANFQQESDTEAAVVDNPIQEARVDAVIEFMKANLDKRITLPQLCRMVNLSSSQFSRVFKTQTGVSSIDYLIRLRMEKAGQLLSSTFLSVKEVMAKVGYGNRQHFLSLFKRQFNTTPTAYRKRVLSHRRR